MKLDYLMSLNGHADVFGIWWDRRNADLRYVLNSWQYDKYVALSHFYRPVAWKAGSWTFAVYSHYNRGRFYNDRPTVFVTYKGGNNRRDVRFYADRKVTKPAVHHANNVPAKVNKSSNGSTQTTIAVVQATSEDADKSTRFAFIYAFKKGHGEFSEMGVPFLNVKHELCSFRAYTVIVSRYRKLVDKHVNFFLLQILGQLQFNGHPSLIIAQVPDTFSQNSIYHRPYFILSAPDSIEVSHCSESLSNRLMLYSSSSKSMN